VFIGFSRWPPVALLMLLSIDDIEKAIYLEYGRYPGHMSPEILTMERYITAINNLTGYDFTSFFDNYYYSTGYIDIDPDLTSDVDGNGLTTFQEVLLNYKPRVPKPIFGGSPTSGSPPLAVSFTDLSNGSISSWLWDFGDGTTSSNENPSHTYNSERVYTVSLRVTGSGGSDTETKVNYIVVRQEAISTPSTPTGATNGTTGKSYNYTAGDSSSNLFHPLEYRFDWGDGTYSGWSSSSSASKSWSSFRSCTVKAQARCETDTSVVSDWSSGLTVNITVPITLQSPSNNASFGACSLYSPPSFSWTTGETFTSYEIQFSPDESFSSTPVKVRVSGTVTQMVMALNTWKRVLSVSGMSGGTVYWKVVGTRTDREIATSDIYSIIMEAAEPVEGETISPISRTSLPTLSWENNCNTKFKVWFGNDPDFTKNDMKKKALSFNVKNPNENNGLFTRPLIPGQWMVIRKVVGDVSGLTIYLRVPSSQSSR
jgi:PKD repeat protein